MELIRLKTSTVTTARNVFLTEQIILQEVKYSLAFLMCAQQGTHRADSIYAMSRTHHLEIWSLYMYVCKNSLYFSSNYCHRKCHGTQSGTKTPTFQKTFCLSSGQKSGSAPCRRRQHVTPKRSHIDRQYERTAGTCKWHLSTKNWPLPQLGRAHNTRYFRLSSV